MDNGQTINNGLNNLSFNSNNFVLDNNNLNNNQNNNM